MPSERVVVVGGGIGGLAVAARLAKKGLDVELFEKEPEIGGRLGRKRLGPYTFDIGPTILLFPEILHRLYRDLGAELDVSLLRCEPNYRVHFADGSGLTMSRDRTALERELEALSPGASPGFFRLLDEASLAKRLALEVFLSRPFDAVKDMVSFSLLRALFRANAHRSVASLVGKHVSDERLRRTLTFQTMYLGVSPFDAPAVFTLLPATELEEGIWYAKGGLHEISRSLARCAESLGVKIRCRTPVRAVATEGARGSRERASGVILEDGRFVRADAVVANVDLPFAYRVLLRRPLVRPFGRPLSFTSSALVFFFGTNRRWEGFHHHNVFFGKDYDAAFREIFRELRVPSDPSFYVADPAASDPSVAPSGGSALYVLVPVPRLGGATDWRDRRVVERLKDRVLARLEATVAPGLRAAIVEEAVMTPLDWRERFSLEHGSAFGLAHTLDQVGGFRPPQCDPELEDLYFVGASTQPATGIPNVLIGAEQVAARFSEVPRRSLRLARTADGPSEPF